MVNYLFYCLVPREAQTMGAVYPFEQEGPSGRRGEYPSPTPVVSLQEPLTGQLFIQSSTHYVLSGRGFLNPALTAVMQTKEENEEISWGDTDCPALEAIKTLTTEKCARRSNN